jgi:hypothetical protein
MTAEASAGGRGCSTGDAARGEGDRCRDEVDAVRRLDQLGQPVPAEPRRHLHQVEPAVRAEHRVGAEGPVPVPERGTDLRQGLDQVLVDTGRKAGGCAVGGGDPVRGRCQRPAGDGVERDRAADDERLHGQVHTLDVLLHDDPAEPAEGDGAREGGLQPGGRGDLLDSPAARGVHGLDEHREPQPAGPGGELGPGRARHARVAREVEGP